ANSIKVDFKEDGSPLTLADKAAEHIILKKLNEIIPEILIISEEDSSSHNLKATDQFFLIDPLDGTKEFLKKDGLGSFTVNIGLIENGIPTLGVVYAPALHRMFFASVSIGAFEESNDLIKPIAIRALPHSGAVAVASVSHRDELTNTWLNDHKIKNTTSIGSSLKFCLVACGEADVYPRFGPTMEWDTAAGDAVLRCAGGSVTLPNDEPFRYGKSSYRNGPFIARGSF
ncbi:MAG: 3'(2'), 5'-bisphosphate nucleotidase, partial [Woeseiaceae bacterium]